MNGSRIALFACLALLGGCARVSTTTSIRADGSFDRKVVYTVSKSNMPSAKSGQGNSPDLGGKPEDTFKIPESGSGIKVVRSEDETNQLVTTTRAVPTGAAPLQDLTIWASPSKPLVTSTVLVRKLANGQIEYLEKLHSLAPGSTSKEVVIPDLRNRVKNVLPEEYRVTELIDQLTKEVTRNLFYAMFGPPTPMVGNFLLDPDGAARRVNGLVVEANAKSLSAAIPKLTSTQAMLMSRSLASVLNLDALNKSNPASASAAAAKPDSNPNEMTPMFFCVGFPGRVVATNGLTDPLTGQVYWSLLPVSLGTGDIELRLVVQP